MPLATINTITLPPTEPIGIMCPHCEIINTIVNTIVKITNGHTQTWCQECIDEDSFVCSLCEDRYTNEEINHPTREENTSYCNNCFNEKYSYCYSCNAEINPDDTSWVGDNNYCDNCYEEEFFFCRFCEETKNYDEEEFKTLSSEPGIQKQYICSLCIETTNTTNPSRLTVCPESQEIIDLHLHSSYYIYRNIPISRNWAYNNLTTDIITRLNVSQHNLARQYIEQIKHNNSKKTISQLQSSLINKIKKELESRPNPTISPAHDKIYIGMEIECYGGKYLTYTKSNAPYGKSLDMGPHKLLNHELPIGTKMVHDGSIRGTNGQEFLPPIVKKKTDWNKINKLIKGLTKMGWESNETCGIHFHFSHALINTGNQKLIKEIFRIFYFLEPLIFQCLPKNRRDNEYCKPISKYFTEKEIKQDIKLDYWYYGNFWKKKIRRQNDHNGHPTFIVTNEEGQNIETTSFGETTMTKQNLDILKKEDHYFVGRYIGCNLHSLYQKGTIELRYFPSIIDFSYIYTWAQMMTQVFSYALKGGTHDKIEAIYKSTDDNFERKLKELSTIFNWETIMVKFLLTEYKTYSKNKQIKTKYDLKTGEEINIPIDSEGKRLKHLETAILSSNQIPQPTPEELKGEKEHQFPKETKPERRELFATSNEYNITNSIMNNTGYSMFYNDSTQDT